MKQLPQKRMSPEERAEVRAIRRAVSCFAKCIETKWPDVEIDVCFEQLCVLGGHSPPKNLDRKARKAVLATVVQARGNVDLSSILIKHAKYSLRRAAAKERKKNPPPPEKRLAPSNGAESKLVSVEEHVVTLASLPDTHFKKLPEWRSLRMHVLRRCDGRCEMCGASRKEFRLEPRHIIPRNYAPERAFDPTNIKALCPRCSADGGWTRQIAWEG